MVKVKYPTQTSDNLDSEALLKPFFPGNYNTVWRKSFLFLLSICTTILKEVKQVYLYFIPKDILSFSDMLEVSLEEIQMFLL